ncbi:MAG: RluA family pseudouridine synthase [Deltaproteobacteria bacterium]|jgi:23S rRNA pseudouridine1911/1915/1917 synthase|nr:RluA family pseudouridine synthase [Deltaproteobacteria bacterium]
MSPRIIHISVPENTESLRIDKYLSSHPEILTRSRAEYLIENHFVTVNKTNIKSSYKIKAHDQIQILIADLKLDQPLQKLNLELEIIFEDADLIVLNKPSGLVVHPAAGHQNDTLVNALVNHTDQLSMKFGEDRPGIVHRIDKETSGLLVIAKNDKSHLHLSQQFKARSIQRRYEAVVLGLFQPPQGQIISYLARHPKERKRFASVRDKNQKIVTDTKTPPSIGKLAITNFNLLKTSSKLSLVELKLETGRTHQIRIHLSEKGFPLLGDPLYGNSSREKILSADIKKDFAVFNRFFLHAKCIGFIHPNTGKELYFEQDWPDKEKEFILKWIK